MIRIVTTGRLRRLREDASRGRAHAREVRGQADAAFGEHVRQVWELTARAESAESDAGILREHVGEIEAALNRARADLAERAERVGRLLEELEAARREGRSLVLLLHYGEPHSIHADHDAAHAYVAARGIPVHAWVPSDERPAVQVLWRIVAFTRDEAVHGFRAVNVPSPEGWEGVA
ncbi:hypothetical protein SAMN04487980_1013236 [Streptomyces sp. cf124]|uniref:hypothetical protein n=1 Tax=Streptomyces sp. cf124 TaxID=1761903 RepID=UPI0008E13B3B|nr:hypothetical protein [Streptomyces sp. cf124]SFN21112.1 hypothetical protein SAMN04487980_1013236 [Streptomyces sp. cf124]